MPEMMCNNCIGRVSPIRQTVVQHHRTIIGILYNNISPLGSISLYFIIDGLRLLPARHWIREGSPIAFPLEVSLRIKAVGEAGAHCGGRADELHHHRAPALLRWLLDFTGKCRNWPCKQFIELSYPPHPPPPPPPLTCYVAGQRNQELPQSPLVVEFVIFLCY